MSACARDYNPQPRITVCDVSEVQCYCLVLVFVRLEYRHIGSHAEMALAR